MSIFSTSNWSSATTYNIHEFVKYNNKFYYSLTNNNNNNTPSPTSVYWGGVSSHNGITKPKFFFKPSYNNVATFAPAAKNIKFGDGYEQRVPDGINNTLLKVDLNFELRTKAETAAINHFLKERHGCESFIFVHEAPFDMAKLFVCRDWDTSFQFFDNYSIRARFEEVVN